MLETNILTDVLGAIVNGTSSGFDGFKQQAESLFYSLMVLEIVFLGIGIALNRVDFERELIIKILAIGAVQALLFHYVWLVDSLKDGLVALGLSAAGNNLAVADFLDPSAFIRLGFDKVFEIIWNRDQDLGAWDILSSFGLVPLLHIFSIIISFVGFAACGLLIFLAVAEFYLVSTLAIILMPFLVFKRTSFLGLRAINSLLAIGIKLMVMAFISSLSLPVIELLELSSDPTIKETMSLAVGITALVLLMWRAPSMAMSLLSGNGGMDAGSVIAPAVHAGGLAMLGGQAAFSANQELNNKLAKATAEAGNNGNKLQRA